MASEYAIVAILENFDRRSDITRRCVEEILRLKDDAQSKTNDGECEGCGSPESADGCYGC